jgi:hypothetical protein
VLSWGLSWPILAASRHPPAGVAVGDAQGEAGGPPTEYCLRLTKTPARMPYLPAPIVPISFSFAPVFTAPTRRHVQVVVDRHAAGPIVSASLHDIPSVAQ